jgi:hypothetical protein
MVAKDRQRGRLADGWLMGYAGFLEFAHEVDTEEEDGSELSQLRAQPVGVPRPLQKALVDKPATNVGQ